MDKIDILATYKHEKRGGVYKALFTELENKPEYVVYIDDKNQIWAKKKERFLKGMVKININSENFLYQEKIDEKLLLNEGIKEINDVEIVCIANKHSDDKTDYPLMIVVCVNNIFKIYTIDEFKNEYQT